MPAWVEHDAAADASRWPSSAWIVHRCSWPHHRSLIAVRRHVDVSPEATPPGSELTITEDGEVSNPIFRFISRFVFGHAATIEGFLKSVEAIAGTPAGGSHS